MKDSISELDLTFMDVNRPPFGGAKIGLDFKGNPFWINAKDASKNKKEPVASTPDIEKVIPIMPSQMEIWLGSKMGGEQANKAYNESISLRLKGELSVTILEKAFLKVIERHESMRSIVSTNGKSFIVFKTNPQSINKHDLSGTSSNEKDAFLKNHLEKIASFNFNLGKGPLYVVDLIKLEENEHLLTFVVHHLIFDGWSFDVFLEELGILYSALLSGDEPNMPDADLLSDYSKDYFKLMRNPSYQKTLDFWQKKLSNPVPRLDLPIDHLRTKIRGYNSKVHRKWFDTESLDKVNSVAAKLKSSPNLVLLSIFEIFLRDWTKQDDIVVGVPIAGQVMLSKRRLIGHCVSLLPLVSKIDLEMTFSEYLKSRKVDYYAALEHSSISFGEMIKNIQFERDSSRVPLIPVTFNVDLGIGNDSQFKGLQSEVENNPKSFAMFEMILNLLKTSKGFVLNWTYNSHLFNASTIEAACNRFFKLVDYVLENPEEKISKISDLLSPEVGENVIGLDGFQPLGEMVKNQLNSRESKLAVRVGSEEYSYADLRVLTNAISMHLVSKGVGPGKIVGVHLDRTITLVASALAVVQVGACYMPIDTEYPEDRVKFMLNDVDVTAFLTDNTTYTWGGLSDRKIQAEQIMASAPEMNFVLTQPNAEDPLFIVYTSGSTGNPKGVVLSQRNLSDFLKHFVKAPGLNENDIVLGLTSISFDMSFMELVLPFIYGASLHLMDRFERRDPREIVKTTTAGGITILFATPSHLKAIVEHGLNKKQEGLTIVSAGEPLELPLAQSLTKAAARVYNIYGPTEATIYTNIKEIFSDAEIITIGKPVDGTDLFLLDENGNIVTTAEVLGELYIGGSGVGIGYLNREELTQEKFILNPFPRKTGRYYRTGDLAIWTADGEIICKGRIDHQVKIRGQRLELGEIENRIAQDEAVKNVIVEKFIDENGDDSLIAFVSFKKNEKNSIDSETWIDSCKQSLTKVLSSFMIPSHFVIVDNFELTPNGKIDRKAARLLVKTSVKAVDSQSSNVTSEGRYSETVLEVKAIWEETLNSPDSGLDLGFFQVGGHSLLAVDLITKIEKRFDLSLPLSFLFENSTINSISNKIDQLLENKSVENGVLVKIKDGSSDNVLFFIHGVGLNPLEVKSLNDYMDEDQSIWGLQSPTIQNSNIDPLESIEEMASLYLDEIKNKGFVGPFNLLGNSIGGQIAFEMAKQVISKGEKIGFLGMIDTIRPFSNDIPNSLTGRIGFFAKRLGFEFKFLMEDPLFYWRYRVNYLEEKFGKLTKPIAKEDLGNLKSRISQIERVNLNAWSKYKHEHVNVDITLFMANKKTFFVSDFKTFGWESYVNSMHTIHMPGEHANMLKPPHGVEFSRALQDCLNSSSI